MEIKETFTVGDRGIDASESPDVCLTFPMRRGVTGETQCVVPKSLWLWQKQYANVCNPLKHGARAKLEDRCKVYRIYFDRCVVACFLQLVLRAFPALNALEFL